MSWTERPVDGRRSTADDLLDLLHAARPAWQARAACAGRTDVMFPDSTRGRGADYREALMLCARCQVAAECRTWSAAEEHGVWGGIVRDARMASQPYPVRLADDTWRSVHQIARAAGLLPADARRELRRMVRRGEVETVIADHGGRIYRNADRGKDTDR